MKNKGHILATVGSTKATAVVAWDGMNRDEVLDALDAVVNFLEGNHKGRYMAAGLRSGRDVRLSSIGKPNLPDLDLEG